MLLTATNTALLSSIAILCNRFLPKHDHGKVDRNIQDIIARAFSKAFLLYFGPSLVVSAIQTEHWTHKEWTAWRACLEVHTSLYLFDIVYRRDTYLLLHHLIAIPALQTLVYLAATAPLASELAARCVIPFWIPGVVFGDLAEDLSYLFYQGVLGKEMLWVPKHTIQRAIVVLGALSRITQWTFLTYLMLRLKPYNSPVYLVLAVVGLPVFAYYEFLAVVKGFRKAWM